MIPVPNISPPSLNLRYETISNPQFMISRFQMDDTLALLVMNEGRPYNLSVSLFAYEMRPPEKNQIFVKAYGAFEGLAEALEQIGIATKVNPIDFNYGNGWLMKLTFDAESLVPIEQS